MHIRKTYIGSDTRRLLPEKVEFAGVSGDNETATLIFEFPETYADYDKYIEWNIEIPFPDSKKTFKPLYPLTDDSFVIPRRLTKVCNGLDVDFNLVFVKDNTLIEKSLQSTVHFATSANGDAIDDETDETSPLYMLIANAHIKAEYSENDVSYRPQITFTALDGSTQTLTLNMPYLNDAGKIPDYFLDKVFVVEIFSIASVNDLISLTEARKSDWAITPEQDLYLLTGEDYSISSNWLKVYSHDPTYNSITISNKSTTGSLEVLGNTRLIGDLDVDSNLNVSQDVSVTGSVTTGTLEALQDVLIGGNAEVGGDLLVNGSINTVIDVHASNDLSSARDTTVGRDLRVDGNASVGGDLLVEGSINTVINVNAQNDLTSVRDIKSGRNLEVEGTTLLKGDVTALSGVNITGDVLIGGNTEIKGDLDVDGSIDTVINVNAQTDLTAGQDLKATRNLEIGGTSTLKGDVLVEADLQAGGGINTSLSGNSPVVTDANGKLTVANISVSDLENLTGIEGNVQLQIDTKEDKINKVNSWAGTPSDVSYPSEKLVKSSLDTKVDKNTAITSDTKCKVTYDAKGLVTGGADLADTDVPPLSTSKIVGLDTTLSGINTTLGTKVDKNDTIVGATKAKITYDSKGLVTAGADLVASDIPNLNASKINAGTLGVDRIPNISANKITSDTLTDARIPSNIERNTNKIQDIQSTIGYTGSDTDYPSVHAVQKYTSGVSTPILEAISDLQDDKADDDKVVHKAGNETIAGIKTFSDNVEIGTTLVPKQLSIKGNLLIDGNITQNGSSYETHAQQVYTTDDKIIMRDGATAGLIAGDTSGLTFKKYDGTNDGELSVDSSGTARVGDVGDLQPLATRDEIGLMSDDTPVVWDADNLKLVTRQLTKGDVGLDNVSNLAPADLGISTATQTALDNTVKKTGNEEIAGIKTFTTGIYQKSTQDIGVAGYNSRIINRLYDVNNELLFNDQITKESNIGTGRKVLLGNKDTSGTYFSVQHLEFVEQNGGYKEYIVTPSGVWKLYRTLNGDGTGYSSTPYRSYAQATDTDILTKGHVADILAPKQDKLTFDTAPTTSSTNPVTSDGIKTALDAKQDTLTFDTAPTTSSTNPVTSGGVKTALDAKQDTITGGATTIATTNLTGLRALVSDASGKVGVSTATATQLGYLVGVTSAIQTQLNSKQATLTFDTSPTSASTNPVTSGGVKTALDGKVSKTGYETIEGVKTFTDTPIVSTNYSSIQLKSKLENSNIYFYTQDQSAPTTMIRGEDYGSITAYTQIRTRNNRTTQTAEITIGVEDNGRTYATAPLTNNTPTTYEIITGGWITSKLALKQDKLTFDTTPTASSTNPVTSGGIKTALDTKQNNITGGATTIASSNLTASRALISDGSGKVAVSAVTATELGYVDGVTSPIQTQLNGKQPNLTFDTTPTASSLNPVTSGGIKTALDAKQNSIPQLTCATAVSTTAKVITGTYTPQIGDIFAVKFTSGNTANSITLNINGGGAKQVRTSAGQPSSNSNAGATYAIANGTMLFYATPNSAGTSIEYYNLLGSQDLFDADTTMINNVRLAGQALKVSSSSIVGSTASESRDIRAYYPFLGTLADGTVDKVSVTGVYIDPTTGETSATQGTKVVGNTAGERIFTTNPIDLSLPIYYLDSGTSAFVSNGVVYDSIMCIEAVGTTNWKYSIGRFYDASGTLRDNSYMSVDLAQQNLYIGGILSVDANGKQFMTPMEYSMSLRNTDYVYKMIGGTTSGTASTSPYYNHSIFSQPVFRYVDGAWIQGDGISTVTPADLAKIANLPANTISDLSGKVSKTGDETISGTKTFTSSPIIYQNYGNLILKSKLANSNVVFHNGDSSDRTTLLRSQDDGATYAYSQLHTVNNRTGKVAEIVVRVNDADSEGYVTASRRSNPGSYDVVTKGYLDTRLTDKQDNLTFDSAPASGSTNPVTSGGVKTALDAKQDTITGGATTIASSNLTASRALISDGSGKVAVSAVTSTELGHLDGVTSAIQSQLNAKQATLTFDLTPTASSTNPVTSGGVKTALDAKQDTINFTPHRVLVTGTDGKVATTNITTTHLGYLSGVTSAIQTQLNGKQDKFSLYEHTVRVWTTVAPHKFRFSLTILNQSPTEFTLPTLRDYLGSSAGDFKQCSGLTRELSGTTRILTGVRGGNTTEFVFEGVNKSTGAIDSLSLDWMLVEVLIADKVRQIV